MNLTADEAALQGVLWATRGAWLVLRQAALLKGGQAPTPIDGEAIVHRDQVAFLQVLP